METKRYRIIYEYKTKCYRVQKQICTGWWQTFAAREKEEALDFLENGIRGFTIIKEIEVKEK